MTQFAVVLACVVVAAGSQFGSAIELGPVTEFTIRGASAGGSGNEIDSDPFGIFGFVQHSSILEDETFSNLIFVP